MDTIVKRQDRKQHSFALALFYIALFSIIGVFMPFFPAWLSSKGLSPLEISLCLAIPMPMRIVSSMLVSYWADKSGNYRKVLCYLGFEGLVSILALYVSAGFWAIFIVTAINAFFTTPIMPITETMAMASVRSHKIDYGQVRLWGSVSFILVSLCLGWFIDLNGPHIILVALTAGFAFTLMSAFFLPNPQGTGQMRRATVGPSIDLQEIRNLMGDSSFMPIIWLASLAQASHVFLYGFGTLHWQSLGFSGFTIGWLWTIGVVAEIILFAFAKPLFKKWAPVDLILFGTLCCVLRWVIMMFDPPLTLLYVVQLLHAFTFGAVHLGIVYFIAQTVPDHLSASAQALYSSMSAGLLMGLLMLFCGPLHEAFGGGAYGVMALMCLFAVVLGFSFRNSILKQAPQPHRDG